MPDQTASELYPFEPVKHYGHCVYRPGYTACGKQKTDLVNTYFPANVTCDVCADELTLQRQEATTR